jgi:hypothetical protein
MLIQCTKKLLDKLGLPKDNLEPPYGSESQKERIFSTKEINARLDSVLSASDYYYFD